MGKAIKMGAFTFFDRWGSRLSDFITLAPLAIPAGLVGVLTGYLAQGVTWISQFGRFGWCMAGLLGFFVTAVSLALLGYARERWANARAIQKWSKDVDDVNPMVREYRDQRIRLIDLANPTTKQIYRKRFINCEIIGPATVLLLHGGKFDRTGFLSCNLIPVKNGFPIAPIYMLIDCEFVESNIYELNIIFPIDMIPALESGFQGNAIYLSLTGDQEIDDRRSPPQAKL